MKLEKFKEKNNRKIGIIIFTICCIVLIAGVYFYSSFAIYEQNQNFNVINGTVENPGDLYFAFYVDDVISKDMPSKDSGYTLDTSKSFCTNGASPTLNEETWSIKVTNLTATHTKCTLYFKVNITNQIIAQLDTSGACPTVNEDGTINVSAERTNGYVCSAPDDYGTSYYYRGNVTNNYVKFGKNESGQDMYWRIIRINGDGSIRMIYDGTSAHQNGEENDDRNIGTSTFNSGECLGYIGDQCFGSVSYTYNNHQNDSIIKSYVDDWYERVFLGSPYESYLSDEIFCVSRVIDDNNFGIYKLVDSLRCTNEEDRYTVDVENGNGGLTYPIGLVNVIEGRLAGGADFYEVSGHYLDAGIYWTMTPNSYDMSYGLLVYTIRKGMAGAGPSNLEITNSYGVKPVINLKTNSLNSGNGTAENPYTV